MMQGLEEKTINSAVHECALQNLQEKERENLAE